MKIKTFERPGRNKPKVINAVVEITKSVSGKWFTKDVQDYVSEDLKYQDLCGLFEKRELKGFIVYTCIDGKMAIMLMAIKPENHNKGYGTYLYKRFEEIVKEQGFDRIVVQTVPEEVNENYRSTIMFYKKQGFKIVKRYTELWEHGAIELEKDIQSIDS